MPLDYVNTETYASAGKCKSVIKQELIRRWDSEREHFYDDIAHVGLLQNTKKENLFCLTN